jgi:hypothetical protein
MANRRAIVTLATGDEYEHFWDTYCEANWVPYAERIGCDLIRLTEPLDTSDRARGRSPSWQKCLILGLDFASRYERIIWIDADIIINLATAPDIVGDCPPERVGAVLAGAHLSEWASQLILGRVMKWPAAAAEAAKLVDATGLNYAAYGLPDPPNQIIQCGTLVLSPLHHREMLERIYHDPHYPSDMRQYEQPPLSYEVLTKDIHYPLDGRFNYTFFEQLYAHHPFLADSASFRRLGEICASPGMVGPLPMAAYQQLLQHALVSEFYNSYFFHLAGALKMAPYLPSSLFKMAPPDLYPA